MLTNDTIDFAADFRWDPRAQRYKWTSGAGKNQFASKAAILNRSRTLIVDRSNELVDLGSKLASGAIGLEEFQRSAVEKLKDIHILNATLGATGSENLFANDYLTIARELGRQYHRGRGDDGRPYGIKHLAKDILGGNVSEAQLRARLKQYAASGKKTYWAIVQSKNEGKFGFRVLTPGHKHCEDCLRYAAEPPKPVEAIVAICTGCRCRNQCVCRLRIFDTLEQAIEAKG